MSVHLSEEDVRALVEGRAPARGAADVDEHLLACGDCRRRVRDARDADAHTEVSGEGEPGAADAALVESNEARYEYRRTADGALEELGRGGFGKVVLVRDATLGRDVAMKRLTSERLARARGTSEARLLREARVLGQLEHPAIVPLHEVGRGADGQLYYTMRRIRGRTLADALKDATTLDERLRLVPHVLTACHAVAYAHSRGVVHRDLKPHNLMLDRFGATYLIDWGLSRAKELEAGEAGGSASDDGALQLVTSDQTIGDAGGRIGTAAYMSPEHIEGPRARVDERSDVWGLGAMLYQVLTGRPPRDRASPDWRRPPRPAHVLVPEVPRDLSALCEKAMAEDPAARYQTAEALAADLDAWLHGRQVSAHAYRPRELLVRFVRANRLTVAVASVLLLALLGLGVTSYLRVRTERNQARAFAHLIVDQVLERLASAQDEAFTRTLVAEVTTWLRQQGASGDSAAVSWAWFLLARQASRVGAPSAELSSACLDAARGVDDPVARAASFGCRVVEAVNGAAPAEEDMRRLQALEREIPSGEEANLQAWLEVQVLLSLLETQAANSLVDFGSELRHTDRLLDFSRRALEHASDRAGGLGNVARALSSRSLLASSLGDGDAAIRYGQDSIAVARQAVAERTDRTTLEVLSENLSQQASVLRWHSPEADTRELTTEARRLFEARVVLTPNNFRTRTAYARLLLDVDEPSEAWRVLRPVDVERTEAFGKSMIGFSGLATGNARELVAHRRAFESENEFDCMLVLALGLGLSGDLLGGSEVLEKVKRLPMVSAWPAPTMNRFARELSGPLAPGLRRLVADMERAQLVNDDAVAVASISQLAAEWRALAAAAK